MTLHPQIKLEKSLPRGQHGLCESLDIIERDH